jgi:methionyl-tRNA formyltransferase
LKILFAGTTANAAEVLRYLHKQARHEIVGVLTRNDAQVGRKRELRESAVGHLAGELGLRLIKANVVDDHTNDELAKLDAELGLVVAYGALLKRQTLGIPAHGWINIHFSLLPELRGAAPVQRAIIQGLRETGVSIFKLDEGMDTGPILAQVPTVIEHGENAGDLLSRLTNISLTMLDECLSQIESGTQLLQTQSGEATIAAKLTRLDARIDFNKPALSIEHLVLGCNPEPVAWAEFNSEPIRVLDARATRISGATALKPGEVALLGDAVCVGAGDNQLLQLIEVQPASKRAMKAIDWYRGLQGSAVLI